MSRSANILILTRVHKCLLIKPQHSSLWMLPTFAPQLSRQLPAIKASIKETLGLELPSPIGSSPIDGEDGLRDFAFLITSTELPSDGTHGNINLRWVPIDQAIQQIAKDSGNALRKLYSETLLGGYQLPEHQFDVFYFGNTPEMASRLAHMVVKGTKRCTTGLVATFEKEGLNIPRVGIQSIVTDFFGVPLCAVETVEVRKLRFSNVAKDVAAGEGEGDHSYEDWRGVHEHYFRREADSLGLSFDSESQVFNEFFSLKCVFMGLLNQ